MNRTQRLTVAIGVFAIVTVLGAAAGAQEPKKSAQPANPPSVVSAVAPEAAALIDRMGTYLQTISAFAIHAETTTDEVLLVGPKVQFGGTIDGTFENHDSVVCDTGGATFATVAIPEASSYYLVVPNNGSLEGSYGTRNLGGGAVERPAGASGCYPQAVAPCPVE